MYDSVWEEACKLLLPFKVSLYLLLALLIHWVYISMLLLFCYILGHLLLYSDILHPIIDFSGMDLSWYQMLRNKFSHLIMVFYHQLIWSSLRAWLKFYMYFFLNMLTIEKPMSKVPQQPQLILLNYFSKSSNLYNKFS